MHVDSGGGAVAIIELAILCMNEHVHLEMKKLIEMQHKQLTHCLANKWVEGEIDIWYISIFSYGVKN